MFKKIIWFSVDNESLDWKKENREEALNYDKHAVGVSRKNATLVGHLPIELSNLIDYFLKDAEENFASTAAVVPRKREVGLSVPAKFTAVTKNMRVATALSKESLKVH